MPSVAIRGPRPRANCRLSPGSVRATEAGRSSSTRALPTTRPLRRDCVPVLPRWRRYWDRNAHSMIEMSRTALASLFLALLVLGGCGWFDEKKQPLPGERISVLSLARQLEPGPDLSKIAITLPPPVVNPDWPEPGGYPNHAMQHLSLPERLTQAWRASTGEGASRYTRVLSQPVVAKGRVYAMDGAVQVGAYDAATGNRVWQLDLKPEDQRGNSFRGGVAYWNDRVFVSTGYAQLLALHPADGRVIWKTSVAGPVRSGPTVSDGRVFAVTVDNELVVLAADDGRRLWNHNAIPETASLLGSASPAVEGEVVVAAYSSGELHALTVETGRPLC